MAERKLDVYGVGNALVDLQVRVADDFLATLEVPKGQMLLVDDARQGQVLSRLDGRAVNRCSGGSAANTIVGVAELGGRAGYCGKVAADELGEFYVSDLERIGVEIARRPLAGQTGTCLVMITPDAQRSMMTNLGASSQLTASDIDVDAIARAAYVYIEGYLFTGKGTEEAAIVAIEAAKANGCKVALTASDPFVINMKRELLWDLIKGPVDLLFCNEQEARALTQLEDPVECARELHRHSEAVAMTLGANGSILMHGDELFPIEGIPVAAVDTTGAGDMYAAGILFGRTHGLSWTQAGHLASHAAALVVSRLGARLPTKFSPEQIAELIAGR